MEVCLLMANGIIYINTAEATLPGWPAGELRPEVFPIGVAYETETRFVHRYAKGDGLWTMSNILAIQGKHGNLEDWCVDTFGATHVLPLNRAVGCVTKSVWRPGLFLSDQVYLALATDRVQQRRAEQSLQILIDRLSELLLFIEPNDAGMDAYSLKTRELLILACTDVEDMWTHFLSVGGKVPPANGFSTNEYVKLQLPLHLADFIIELAAYPGVGQFRPFGTWLPAAPTQSLGWYEAYNKTKHGRTQHLDKASLRNCVQAVAANIILYCVRFSPFPLFNESTPVASMFQHLFSVKLDKPDLASFYLPVVELPADFTDQLSSFSPPRMEAKWTTEAFVI
jgi:hypothetical protein